MAKLFFIIKMSVVVFLSCLPRMCYSNNSGDFFDNLPENTIISFDKSYLDHSYIINNLNNGKAEAIYIYPDYTQILLEFPDGQSDTIWIESETNTYVFNNEDGRREIINTCTFNPPQIDYESPNCTTKIVDGREKVYINDARYPADAISKGIEGKIIATCIVEKDGSLSNVFIKEPICPSIDREAYRILSQTKFIPCKLGDKTFRCHHKIALSFSITKYRVKDIGSVCFDMVENLPNGVDKRYSLGLQKYDPSVVTYLEIDIPENNQNLEELLCQILFDKVGKSIEEIGYKYAKAFNGKINNKEFKDKKGNNLFVTAHVLGFKKDKYYSYVYSTELAYIRSGSNFRQDEKSITHNILYDIQDNRILSATDILTQSYLEELSNNMGFSDLKDLDIGLDDYFLYIGRNEDETIATIGLCQENWNKFTPVMQNILGNKTKLPLFLHEKDFEYDKEPNFTGRVDDLEDGRSIRQEIKFEGLKTKKEGIQPVGIRKGIIRKPTIGSNESLFHEYLTEIWHKSEIQPDSDGFVANISFVINKDQTISNFQTKLKKGDEVFYHKFINLMNSSPKCGSMLFAIDGPVKNYFNYDVEFGGKVYDYVDKMPEYTGGYQALFQWISNEITIPENVPADALNGRIFASCIIEEDGSISNAKVETPIDDSLKKEIERVLAIMPKWNPGKRFGKEVRVKTSIPLRINLVH